MSRSKINPITTKFCSQTNIPRAVRVTSLIVCSCYLIVQTIQNNMIIAEQIKECQRMHKTLNDDLLLISQELAELKEFFLTIENCEEDEK